MKLDRVGWLTATENRRILLVIIGWAVALESAFSPGLYARTYLTPLDIVTAFAVCVLAGALIIDLSKAILGCFVSMALGTILLFGLATLPATLGNLKPPGDIILYSVWTLILLRALFPFQFIIFLVGSIIGSMLGERYL